MIQNNFQLILLNEGLGKIFIKKDQSKAKKKGYTGDIFIK